eukprot:CAMPEP_0184722362 /NCGR_PEP_ID=MMETSP0314-20130426/21896_1 /TAXON_ID=38298 /ORGANISM="Rhodella maculata, Strain CCMP 736" /LENGTH=173 /DNA_ID=CAMNT_0027186941 /DNA_START=454 /DNA_END=971 /DNA_ORIENTATION=-
MAFISSSPFLTSQTSGLLSTRPRISPLPRPSRALPFPPSMQFMHSARGADERKLFVGGAPVVVHGFDAVRALRAVRRGDRHAGGDGPRDGAEPGVWVRAVRGGGGGGGGGVGDEREERDEADVAGEFDGAEGAGGRAEREEDGEAVRGEAGGWCEGPEELWVELRGGGARAGD